MSDRSWPPMLRIASRVLLFAAYMWVVVAGLHVLFPDAEDGELRDRVGVVLGSAVVVAGLIAAVAAARGRWMTEWRAVWFVALALSMYATIDTVRLVTGHADLGGVAVTASAASMMARRIVELWLFYAETTNARRAAREAQREARRWRPA